MGIFFFFFFAWDGREREGMDEGDERDTGSDGLRSKNKRRKRERERECVCVYYVLL